MFRYFILALLLSILAGFPKSMSGGGDSQRASAEAFQESALLPKAETGVERFLAEHPEYDGRGTIVAIFDTGVDPGAAGLQTTSDGKPKVIDIIDGTGSGDVPMSKEAEASEGTLAGLSGRTLKVNPKWKNPTGKYRLGIKPAYDLFPHELVNRLRRERTDTWQQTQKIRERELIKQIENNESPVDKKERQARLDLLRDSVKKFKDPGPVYDCVTFHNGKAWQAVIDTDEDGDLTDEVLLEDYRIKRRYAEFDDASQLNFSVNVYDEGKLLSIVTVCGNHGTHVAGIVSAHYPDQPKRNGIAPGAQIISVKIGDTRLDGMETGAALMRGLKRVAEMKCDLINMSYGEASSTPDHGRLVEEFNQIVREKNVIFVASAGNSGPALSTVGAPGGTTSALIGVGAYVSPDMAKVEYSLRQQTPDLPYTWTSRGPTTDGDWGVDLFAPGGAVAPVANYSLQPSQRMNGTSMASPNACGNIALLLSALKQEEKKFTPSSILRSLQATAKKLPTVDTLAQGPGLIQIDAAYDHHVGELSQAEMIEFDVEIASRNDARGIYIRDEYELQHPVEATVRVRPRLDDNYSNNDKLQFEVPLQLQSDAPWVAVGSHLLVNNGGASFSLKVDPTKLAPGVHLAEVQAVHADHPERGPLFRVPITVTQTTPLKQNRFSKQIKTQAGSLERIFLSPPIGARYAELKVKQIQGNDTSFLYLHNVQLLPGESFEALESKLVVGLGPGEEYRRRIPVIEKRTLEICVAQYWSSLAESAIELEVTFGGITPELEEIVLDANRPAVPLDVTAHLGFAKLQPAASLTKWHQSVLPTKATTKLLSTQRDGLWEAQDEWQLVLEYELDLPSSGNIKLSTPSLTGLIYDAPVDSHRLFVFDANDQLVSTGDMFPKNFSAKTGKHTVLVKLRHPSRDKLKTWEKLPLSIERSIGAIGLQVDHSQAETLDRSSSFGSVELAAQEKARFWLNAPLTVSIPKGARNGDTLTGTLSLIEDDPHPIPVTYVISSVAESKEKSSSSSRTDDLQQAEIQFLLATLSRLNWGKHSEQIEQITERLTELDPKNRALHVQRLHLADNDDRKERLPEVVQLADKVIASISAGKLARYFGTKQNPRTADEKKTDQEMAEAKKDLIDALYRKGRALAYMELPDVVEEHPIKNQKKHDEQFENNFQQLSKWVDTTTKDYFLLHIRRLRRQGNYAQAIQLLNKNFGSEQPVYLHHKKRRDLYELLEWNDWQQNEQNWMLRNFPEERVPF